MSALYFIGDIHGHRDKLITLLTKAHLINRELAWCGGDSRVWFLGDFFDRGDDGIGVVELVMRLQREAGVAGGTVGALLGNHEIMFLAAHRFGNQGGMAAAWRRNGGQERDLQRIKAPQIAWLRNLPALARVDDYLLMHADAIFYREYGQSLDAINDEIGAILRDDELGEWGHLLDLFSQRFAFAETRPDGILRASETLRRYGGQHIVHGHTPIQYMSDVLYPDKPHIYSIKLCINVDGGMYLGADGFVYKAC